MLEVEIIVKGQISERWSDWFENMTIAYSQAGQSMLAGQVTDQSALHGMLSRLWDLGLPLVSVRTGTFRAPEKIIYPNVRAIIERDAPGGKEIVLQMRNQSHEGDRRLELPGGRVEPFESLVGALRREVREETGLELACIEGLEGRAETSVDGTHVECLAPFAAYQTLRGPVDSLGVYFRCQAWGELLPAGDEAKSARWTPAAQVAEWLGEEAQAGCEQHFSWIDRAGLMYYLGFLNHQKVRSEK